MTVGDGGHFTWLSRELQVHEGKGKELIGLAAPGVRMDVKVCRESVEKFWLFRGQFWAKQAPHGLI